MLFCSAAAAITFKMARRKFCSSRGAHVSLLEIATEKPIGTIKTIKGWVKSIRNLKNYNFINVTDGSCCKHFQIVVPKKINIDNVQYRSSVDVTGTVQLNPSGNVELLAETINVVGKSDVTDGYPFVPKQKQSFDHYRQHLHFRPQIEYFASMIRFRNAASLKIHQYFTEKGFVGIHTPVITSNDCEGAGETFIVRPFSEKLIQSMKKENYTNETTFFRRAAFLTVSGQLHLETIVRSISKAYSFNPVFRAENSKSRLHLSEFYMIEAEEAFVSDLEHILFTIENLIKNVISFLMSERLDEIEYMVKHSETNFNQHMKMLEDVVNKPFAVMTFSEARSLLAKIENSDQSDDCSLTKEEELLLVKSNNNIPVFVVDWPQLGKPFYMKESNGLVKAVDLLVPNVGELCGGSLREDNYDTLESKLSNLNLLDSLQWYLELRKFGNVPTGGFGIGFERFLQYVLNCGNIKDTIPFPRWPRGLQL